MPTLFNLINKTLPSTIQTFVATTGEIPAAASEDILIPAHQSLLISAIESDTDSTVRLYSTENDRTLDVNFQEFNLTAATPQTFYHDAIAFLSDTNSIYAKVTNNSASSSAIVLSVMALPIGLSISQSSSNGGGTTQPPITSLSDATVEFIDLALTNVNLKGFYWGFVHDNYAYLIPYYNGSPHGNFTRINLTDFSTVEFIDLALTDTNLKGFIGGFVDGNYAYLVPYDNGSPHGNFTRVNLTDFSTVEVLDLTSTNPDLIGFQGGFVHDNYAYLVPYRNSTSPHGFFTRVNLTDFSTVEVLDLTSTNPDLIGFRQGFVHNNYAYLFPYYDESPSYHGKFTRVNLTDFSTVEFIDLSLTDTNLKGFNGGFVHNDYAYLIPYHNGISLHGNFTRVNLTDFSTVEFIDLSLTNPDLIGFIGGFVDGNYGYLVPYHNGSRHGNFTRVDLTDFSTVEFIDLSLTNTNLKGFLGGFVDGNYAYLVPYNNDSGFHGNFTKISLS